MFRIFISYARKDNELPPEPEPRAKGFITALRAQLEFEFTELGEPTPEFWQDVREVDESDQFDPRIEAGITAADLLVVVLSRNWLNRPYCKRELDLFVRSRTADGLDGQALRERIVVVGKHHVDPDARPNSLQGQTGFNFYRFEGKVEVGREIEFFKRGVPTGREYTEVISRLGNKIWRLALAKAQLPEPSTPSTVPATASNGRTIYLAKPARDMQRAYESLFDELVGNGYAVVPTRDEPVPDVRPEAWMDQQLAGAELSVHLLGELPGPTPDAPNAMPIVRWQLQRARAAAERVPAHAKTAGAFRRYIWLPEVVAGDDDSAAVVRTSADVLTRFGETALPADTLDDKENVTFRRDLVAHLEANRPAPPEPAQLAEGAHVYVLCRDEDRDYAFHLRRALNHWQVRSDWPAVRGEPEERLNWHQQQLKTCDAVLVCWANAPDVWVRAAPGEFENWKRLGRSKDFAWRVVAAGPPEDLEKYYFKELPPAPIDDVLDLTKHGSAPSADVLAKLFAKERNGA